MDRIILPYHSGPHGPPSQRHAAHPVAMAQPVPHDQAKGPGDYLRSLRRRFWLATLVIGLVSITGSIVVLRQPPVFRTEAVVRIEPPQIDTIMASLLAENNGMKLDASTAEQYESNQLANLTNPDLVDLALQDPRVQPHPPGQAELVRTLVEHFRAVQVPRSTLYRVQLEGADAVWITKVLNVWLEKFEARASTEVRSKIDNSKNKAATSIRVLENELARLDELIQESLKKSPVLSPDGENMLLRQFDTLGTQRLNKIVRQEELLREFRLAQLFPRSEMVEPPSREREALAALQEQEHYWLMRYDHAKRTIKRWPNDPMARVIMENLQDTRDQMEAIHSRMPRQGRARSSPADSFNFMAVQLDEELKSLQREEQQVFRQIQAMAPDHSRYLTLLSDRNQKAKSIADLKDRVAEFELVADTQNRPVKVEQKPTEPVTPVAPNKPLYLTAVAMLSMLAGCGLAFFLEHLDHSVRAPEQLTGSLALPLLGVIPRIRRTSRIQRGGHLWTAAAPRSVEADAYRNLRASLVGLVAPTGRPATTLLVTSAKAAEGKSTTALNLAATCARSGERTLLVDVDLRRSSLGDVFDRSNSSVGLVDVLRGELPWQRTVAPTDIPNLDFLPVGDPSGIPVELLGALEMRQLLIALSDHYDRVILDSPAVLGLADCRMLGRIVDSTLLVVRGGANDLRPVLRAKAMLDQARVRLAGIVFNGLSDDVNNWWTNYGLDDEITVGLDGPTLASRGLEAAPAERAALSVSR